MPQRPAAGREDPWQRCDSWQAGQNTQADTTSCEKTGDDRLQQSEPWQAGPTLEVGVPHGQEISESQETARMLKTCVA